MSKFYFVRDSIGQCWVNLDHVTFINLESDKLILKMSNNSSVFVDGDDVVALSQVLWNHTVNWEDEFIDEPSVDYGYDNSQSTDDNHSDIEPTTGIPFKPENSEFKPEDWQPKDCNLDDDEIPI
ncbi:hypothetical protein MiAbW_03596 [Microcystis aeruginosa NIES-4325]|uniref:Uncharacterized protein n=1 Tax=Microcystis aeruginosa NIES-4325 TaxID=2569534 RepID=A0A5J4FE60_MICAE|nr:hypothetical protein [Microcystis aeruginosa]GEA29014.1 hypothetical protein MiAbW_03596 [Microcystis aeruginosa NIES-4325]